MHPYRVRVELPDRPGALARVAGVIAECGGDVIAVDIHELDGSVAVDEIVVDVPEGWEPAHLADGLTRTGAGVLLSSQRIDDERRDPIVAALHWCAAMIAAGPATCDLELGRAVLEVTHATAAWTCDVEEAVDLAAGSLALERGGAVVVRTDGLPPAYAESLPRSVWLLAAPDSALNPTIVAFAARPLSLRFTPTEVARVEMLLQLRQAVGFSSVSDSALSRRIMR
jgi:hypothetical protein